MGQITQEELLKYFKTQLKSLKDFEIEAGDIDGYINTAISLGLSKFWNARFWKFRVKEYTLPITETKDSYEAPAEFRAVKTIREQTTQSGSRIIFKSNEEFDAIAPRQGWHSGDVPEIYTVDYDSSTKKSSFRFCPNPGIGTVITMRIVTKTPDKVEDIDADFYGALFAAVACYFFPLGSGKRADAQITFKGEVTELEQNDSSYAADEFEMMFEAQANPIPRNQRQRGAPW